jgi:hypothetical protein
MVLLPIPLDLHVLSLQLAFILSQDQTLHSSFFYPQVPLPYSNFPQKRLRDPRSFCIPILLLDIKLPGTSSGILIPSNTPETLRFSYLAFIISIFLRSRLCALSSLSMNFFYSYRLSTVSLIFY